MKFRKLWLIYLPAFLIVLQTLLSIFPKNFTDEWKGFWVYLNSPLFKIYCAGFIIITILFIVLQWFLYGKAIKRNKFIEKKDIEELSSTADDIITFFKSRYKVTIRINIMIAERNLKFKRRVKYIDEEKIQKQWVFLKKHLEIKWDKGMQYQPDSALSFYGDEGLCGTVFTSHQTPKHFFAPELAEAVKLTTLQFEKAQDLNFLISCPIYELDYDTESLNMSKKIGVANFDTLDEISQEKREEFLNDVYKKIIQFSIIFSK